VATLAGKLLAEAALGRSDGFATFEALPHRPFPGGVALRWPLLVLAMSWFALRDRLGI
jgi:gamma-glutamylputrescine oxidase